LEKIFVLLVGTEESVSRLSKLLSKAENFYPINFPSIQTEPIEVEHSLEEIQNFDGIIFGSKKAIKYFFDKYPIQTLRNKIYITVGKKTGKLLIDMGIEHVLYPKADFNSQTLLSFIKENWDFFKDKKFLYPKSKIGLDTLEKNLENIYPLYIYTTKFVTPNNKNFVERLFRDRKMNFTIFFSPSSVEGFKFIFPNNWQEYLKSSEVIGIGKTIKQQSLSYRRKG